MYIVIFYVLTFYIQQNDTIPLCVKELNFIFYKEENKFQRNMVGKC